VLHRRHIGTLFSFVALVATPRSASAVGQTALLVGWGKELYVEHCATCHGDDGRGNGPAATALKLVPPDLTLISRAHSGRFPREWVANNIRGDVLVAAHGSREMPIWGRAFEERYQRLTARAAIAALTEYIASLQER
jgi:mono/diheme cytochrome c family protein